MPSNKGAIELSANFIIVIVISVIIVVGGLALFFKMKGNAQQYVDTLDQQTQENIKSMMLASGGKVAVYPQDPTIPSNDAKLVGIGISNIYDYESEFEISVSKIKVYTKDNPDGQDLSDKLPGYNPDDYYSIASNTAVIAPHDQAVSGILVKMPKGAESGQYVYTIKAGYTNDQGNADDYGVVQIYVNNN